jgi:hypothetical protein
MYICTCLSAIKDMVIYYIWTNTKIDINMDIHIRIHVYIHAYKRYMNLCIIVLNVNTIIREYYASLLLGLAHKESSDVSTTFFT